MHESSLTSAGGCGHYSLVYVTAATVGQNFDQLFLSSLTVDCANFQEFDR